MRNKTAFLVHIWYEDVFIEKIYPRILQHNGTADFYFNFVKHNVSQRALEMIQSSFENFHITYSDNPGRDIRGYMRMLEHIYEKGSSYENYVFLHTKTNVDFAGVQSLENLLHGTVATPEILNNVLGILNTNNLYGMVGSGKQLLCGFFTEDEKYKAFNIAERLGLQKKEPNFIAGTMFAVKSSIIDKYLRKDGVIEEFCKDFVENGVKHSGWHHGWERVFGMIVYDSDMKIFPYNTVEMVQL